MISSLKEGYETVEALGAAVIGLSADGVESHVSFCESLGGRPFPLASDADLAVARAYGAVAEDGRSPIRSVYAVNSAPSVVHAIPWYHLGTSSSSWRYFRPWGWSRDDAPPA